MNKKIIAAILLIIVVIIVGVLAIQTSNNQTDENNENKPMNVTYEVGKNLSAGEYNFTQDDFASGSLNVTNGNQYTLIFTYKEGESQNITLVDGDIVTVKGGKLKPI